MLAYIITKGSNHLIEMATTCLSRHDRALLCTHVTLKSCPLDDMYAMLSETQMHLFQTDNSHVDTLHVLLLSKEVVYKLSGPQANLLKLGTASPHAP